ncbi:zinc finger protein 54-like [Ptychodera flava]|uniref:zinc finger protein 54-like n=1 Tax=Ptychodera flava TaxID=63121 RepID=UPI00396A64D6
MNDCFKCLICGCLSDDLNELSTHITTHHVREEQDFTSVHNFLAALQQVNCKRDPGTDETSQMVTQGENEDCASGTTGALTTFPDVNGEIESSENSGMCARVNNEMSDIGQCHDDVSGMEQCTGSPDLGKVILPGVDYSGKTGMDDSRGEETFVYQYEDNCGDSAQDRLPDDNMDAEQSQRESNASRCEQNDADKHFKGTEEEQLSSSDRVADSGTKGRICQHQEPDLLTCPNSSVCVSEKDPKPHLCMSTPSFKTRTSLRIQQRNVRIQAMKQQVDSVSAESRSLLKQVNIVQESHDVGPSFICKICEKKFKCKATLRQHEMGHASSLFQCEFCEKKFLRRNLLHSHVKNFHAQQRKPQPFPCNQCEHVSFSRNGLKRHQALQHFEGRSFKCTYEKCESAFGLRDDLLRHIAAVHEVSKHKYKCEFCSRTFLHKTKFDTHRYSHDKTLSPHVCKQCNRGFSTGDALQGHILTIHENKRPFKCMHCDKAYTKKYALDQHMRKHTGEKISKCTVCGEMFVNASERRHHLKNEHGIGHPCPECGVLFISDYKCNQHFIKQHTKQKKLSCNLCKKPMPTAADLQHHLMTFHRIQNSSVTQQSNESTMPVVGANAEIDDQEDSVSISDPDPTKLSENDNIQIIETPIIAMHQGSEGNGDHVIFVESTELETSLQTDSKTMIVYFCPSDNTSDAISSQDDNELEPPQNVTTGVLNDNDLQDNTENMVM